MWIPTWFNLYSVTDSISTNVSNLMQYSTMSINKPINKGYSNSNNRRIAIIQVAVDQIYHTTKGPWQDSWLSKHNLPMLWARHMIMEQEHQDLSVICWMQVKMISLSRWGWYIDRAYRSWISEKCGGFGASSEKAGGYGQSCCEGICTPCCYPVIIIGSYIIF